MAWMDFYNWYFSGVHLCVSISHWVFWQHPDVIGKRLCHLKGFHGDWLVKACSTGCVDQRRVALDDLRVSSAHDLILFCMSEVY